MNDLFKPKLKRTTIRVSSQPLKEWLSRPDLSSGGLVEHTRQTAHELGVNPHSLHQWVKAGEMPKLVQTALEALKRRMGGTPRSTVFVITVPPAKLEAFKQFAIALGLSLYTIPAPVE